MAATGSTVLSVYSTCPNFELSANAIFPPSSPIPRPSQAAPDTAPRPRLLKQPPCLVSPSHDDDESLVRRHTRLPEPLSISDILRNHNRERLVVHPLRWTARQLQLLECQFRRRKVPEPRVSVNSSGDCAQRDDAIGSAPQQQPRQDEQSDGHQPFQPEDSRAEDIHDIIGILPEVFMPESKVGLIGDLLSYYDLYQDGNKLDLFFHGRRAAGIHTDGVYLRQGLNYPTLAYLDLETHAKRREKYIIPPKLYKGAWSEITKGNINRPTIRLCEKKLSRAKPTMGTEDPYIVAALIALAQEQRDTLRGKGMKTPGDTETPPSIRKPATNEPGEPATCYKVHLILLSTRNRGLYFYNASIPSAFLDKLDQPSRYFPCKPVLISYCRIPLRPTPKTKSVIDDIISGIRDEAGGMTRGDDQSPDTLPRQ